MKQLIYHIIYRTLGVFLVVMAVANASAQIEVDQCDTMEFSVTSRPGIDDSHFVWAIYSSSPDPTDIIDPLGALEPVLTFVDGQYAGRNVKVTGLDPGKYYVRIHVWDEVSCTDNVEMYVLDVIESTLAFELFGDSACIGDQPAVRIVFTGKGPYDLQYTMDEGITYVNMNGIVEDEVTIPITDPLPAGVASFWVMTVTDECKINTYEIDDETARTNVVIHPKPDISRIYLKE